MKQVLLSLKNRAELILLNSVATRNRPLKFKIVVITICVVDFLVMVYCMLNLAKWKQQFITVGRSWKIYLARAGAGTEVHFIADGSNGGYGCFYQYCSWLLLFFLATGDIFDRRVHFLCRRIWYQAWKVLQCGKSRFFRKFGCPKRASRERRFFIIKNHPDNLAGSPYIASFWTLLLYRIACQYSFP